MSSDSQFSQLHKSLITFDGVCGLCNGFVLFFIDYDSGDRYRFVSQQSPLGQRLLKEVGAPDSLDTIVLIRGKKYYTHSTAILRIFQHLDGVWP